jgi:hypothetical protein
MFSFKLKIKALSKSKEHHLEQETNIASGLVNALSEMHAY